VLVIALNSALFIFPFAVWKHWDWSIYNYNFVCALCGRMGKIAWRKNFIIHTPCQTLSGWSNQEVTDGFSYSLTDIISIIYYGSQICKTRNTLSWFLACVLSLILWSMSFLLFIRAPKYVKLWTPSTFFSPTNKFCGLLLLYDVDIIIYLAPLPPFALFNRMYWNIIHCFADVFGHCLQAHFQNSYHCMMIIYTINGLG